MGRHCNAHAGRAVEGRSDESEFAGTNPRWYRSASGAGPTVTTPTLLTIPTLDPRRRFFRKGGFAAWSPAHSAGLCASRPDATHPNDQLLHIVVSDPELFELFDELFKVMQVRPQGA